MKKENFFVFFLLIIILYELGRTHNKKKEVVWTD